MNIVKKRFNRLPFNQKCMLVEQYGKLIWFIDHKQYRINLYNIRHEYIELWFNTETREIDKIRIPAYEELDIHLNEIELTSLFNYK